jgi:hypothetical protein
VNRGSSAWQRNWEIHVDLLEDEIMGPLHKTLINRKRHRFFDLAGPYSYSPSRINTILSLVAVMAWLMLIAASLRRLPIDREHLGNAGILLGLTIFAAFSLFYWGRSAMGGGHGGDFEARTRSFGPDEE